MKRSFKGDQKTRNMAHTSRGPWTFSPKRNEACSLLINGVICEKPPWRIKTVCLRNKNAHKLETLKCILEKTTTLLETSWLKNCGNFLICQTRNWGSSYPKSSTYKARLFAICYQQISTIRPYWLSDHSESGNLFSKNHKAGRFSWDIDALRKGRSAILLRFILKQF